MHKAFISVLVAAVLAVGSLAAFGDGPPAVVSLGYFPNLTHAQAVLGVASGDFQSALGADTQLTTKKFNAGPELISALRGGDIDIAYMGPGPALTEWAQTGGKEIRVVAGAAADGVVI